MVSRTRATIKKIPATGNYVGTCKDHGISNETPDFESCKNKLGEEIKKAFRDEFRPEEPVEIKETVSAVIVFEVIQAENRTLDEFSEPDTSPKTLSELEGRSEEPGEDFDPESLDEIDQEPDYEEESQAPPDEAFDNETEPLPFSEGDVDTQYDPADLEEEPPYEDLEGE